MRTINDFVTRVLRTYDVRSSFLHEKIRARTFNFQMKSHENLFSLFSDVFIWIPIQKLRSVILGGKVCKYVRQQSLEERLGLGGAVQ